MKKDWILVVVFMVAAVLMTNAIYAEELPIDHDQLIGKCAKALKETRSYNVKIEYKNFFTINSQEFINNSATLDIAFISPDTFKVAQVINEGANQGLWDGWILMGNEYYVFNPVAGWVPGDDDNRKTLCRTNNPDGIIKQLEDNEKEYKRDSIRSVTENGIDYIVVKYLFGKELVNTASLPPQLRDSKINGVYEIWINKNTYLLSKQSEDVSYYSNEQNNGTSRTSIQYSSYNDDKIRIDKPTLGDKIF